MPQQDRPNQSNQPNREPSQGTNQDKEFRGKPQQDEGLVQDQDQSQTGTNRQSGQQDKSQSGTSSGTNQER